MNKSKKQVKNHQPTNQTTHHQQTNKKSITFVIYESTVQSAIKSYGIMQAWSKVQKLREMTRWMSDTIMTPTVCNIWLK